MPHLNFKNALSALQTQLNNVNFFNSFTGLLLNEIIYDFKVKKEISALKSQLTLNLILNDAWPGDFDRSGMVRATRMPLSIAAKIYVDIGEKDLEKRMINDCSGERREMVMNEYPSHEFFKSISIR